MRSTCDRKGEDKADLSASALSVSPRRLRRARIASACSSARACSAPSNATLDTLPSYDLTNVRAGVEHKNWSAVVFVNNVANKRAQINDVTQAAENLATYNRIAVSQPLTAGIDLNYRFGR